MFVDFSFTVVLQTGSIIITTNHFNILILTC